MNKVRWKSRRNRIPPAPTQSRLQLFDVFGTLAWSGIHKNNFFVLTEEILIRLVPLRYFERTYSAEIRQFTSLIKTSHNFLVNCRAPRSVTKHSRCAYEFSAEIVQNERKSRQKTFRFVLHNQFGNISERAIEPHAC